jgi:hypothetical protein
MLSIEESALALLGILRPFHTHTFPRSGQAFQIARDLDMGKQLVFLDSLFS